MMRYILLVLLMLMFSHIDGFSQEISLEEGLIQYEDQLHQSVLVSLDIPEDEVKSGFNDFVRENFGVNLKGYGLLTRKDEVYTDFEPLPGLSDESIKLIGIYRKNDNLMELNLLLQRENGTMVAGENDPGTFENLQRMANEFLQTFVPNYYLQIVEEGQDELDDARKEVEKKKDDLQQNREKIADLKEQILRLENEVNEFEKELVRLEDQAEKQSKQFDALKRKQKEALSKLAQLE